MREDDDAQTKKADAILRQMREDTSSRPHQDQRKLRARAAMQRAIEARNKEAYLAALAELGIDLDGEDGKRFSREFDRLPVDRYRR